MSTVVADVSAFVDPDGFWTGRIFVALLGVRGRIGAEIHAKHFARSIGPVQVSGRNGVPATATAVVERHGY